ncbi:hypothetical protein Xekk_01620 [Xenorhabdus sp. KK7.4]|nr:hypothetical protein Xekk_01620 [Xenorhabdus sp. KK7.4]
MTLALKIFNTNKIYYIDLNSVISGYQKTKKPYPLLGYISIDNSRR